MGRRLETQSGETVFVPWTPAEVEMINRWQASGLFHPYTCKEHSSAILVAREPGMYCPVADCAYHQQWVHSFSVDQAFMTEMLRAGRPAR